MTLPIALQLCKAPETADAVAGCLELLYHADGNVQLANRLSAESGEAVRVEWHDPTPAFPAWAVAESNTWTLVLVSGCNNIDHGVRTAVGYLINRTRLVIQEGFQNSYFAECAAPIYATLRGRPNLQNQPVMLAGHSLGGCVVQTLAAQLNTNRDITDNVQICTFGSPKWAWAWQQRQIQAIPKARWMNADDPVPLVYPTINDYLPMLLSDTLVQAQGVMRFTQPSGGLVISGNGEIEAGHYPPLSVVDWQMAMGAWLFNRDDTAATNSHSLSQYRLRLQRWIARLLPPSSRPRGTGEWAPTEEENRRTVTRAEEAVVRQVAAVEREQRETPVRIPPDQLVRVQRRGHVHVLLWNGAPIAVVVRRRSAHSLARDCNRFLAHILHAGLVSPDAIVNQLSRFLGQAETPESGITPLISTELPTADV